MRRIYHALWSIGVIWIFLNSSLGNAGKLVTGEEVRVGEKINGNIYSFARTVDIEDSVSGCVYAFAQEIKQKGWVGKGVKAFAQVISIGGEIRKDVDAFCQKFTLEEGAEIQGKLKAGCEKALIAGKVIGNCKIGARKVEISGIIQGNVYLGGEKLVLLPTAVIEGDLKYSSRKEIEIQEGAKVQRKILREGNKNKKIKKEKRQ